jgi:hypothetical protein
VKESDTKFLLGKWASAHGAIFMWINVKIIGMPLHKFPHLEYKFIYLAPSGDLRIIRDQGNFDLEYAKKIAIKDKDVYEKHSREAIRRIFINLGKK